MDTTAVTDSLTAALAIKDFLTSVLPFLDPKVSDQVVRLLLGSSVMIMIFSWELIGKLLRQLGPILFQKLGGKLDPYKGIINPALAWLLGWLISRDLTVGFLAGGIWTAINSISYVATKKSPKGLLKAKNAAVILGLFGILLANPARAEFDLTKQGTFALGLGVEQRIDVFKYSENIAPVVIAQPGLTLSDHISLRVRYVYPLKKEDRDLVERLEATVWWVF